MSKIVDLFGVEVGRNGNQNWGDIVRNQHCPYAGKRCFKVRKSSPDISIGTCTVKYGRDERNVMICPNRLLQKKTVFTDCIHLLTKHEPGNEFHVVSEVSIPGGSVDYFLASVKNGKVRDFVGIEFQTLDTTGTVFPERERLLDELGLEADQQAVSSKKPFGMNWKMTAKTILVQLHHKIDTFEHVNSHLVLVIQDCLLDYMKKEFNFDHLSEPASVGDSMHFHSYQLDSSGTESKLKLDSRLSTDAEGIASCMGLQAEAKVELEQIVKAIEEKVSEHTLLTLV